MRRIFLMIILALVAGGLPAAQPPRFNYQGLVTDGEGAPLQGAHRLYFSLYRGGAAGVADSGTSLHLEYVDLNLVDGVANHTIGTGVNFGEPLSVLEFKPDGDYFLQVDVDSLDNPILPRTRLESVPFAINSADSDARIPISGPAPYTISTPGSYYLTGNLTQSSPTTDGIIITTGNVTLDLNGYTVGTNKALGILVPDGIKSSGNVTNITVRNGFVADWIGDGIDLESASNVQISGIVSRGNGGKGVVAGTSATVTNCHANGNGNAGFQLGDHGQLEDCAAGNNGPSGVVLGNDCIARRVRSTNNFFTGIDTLSRCVVSECTVSGTSGGDGIRTAGSSMVSGCTVDNSSDDGISVASQCTVSDCVVRLAGSVGIISSNMCTIRHCTVTNTTNAGILGSATCRVEGCNVSEFNGDGIRLSAGGSIINNTVDGKGLSNNGARTTGHGIRGQAATGNIHIEGNTVSDVTTGTQATASVIIRNTFNNNTSNLGTSTGALGPVVTSANIASDSNPHSNYGF